MGTINSNFIVKIPVANALRFTLENAVNNQRANVDQIRFSKAEYAAVPKRKFFEKWETADPCQVEYYSNYPLQKIEVVNCDDEVVDTYTPTIYRQYRNLKYRSQCMFASIDGKLFIYFNEGVEYTDEDFTIPGDSYSLLGRLPAINASAGDEIRYNIQSMGFEGTTISGPPVWNTALQAEGYLTDVDLTIITPVDGLVEITYDEKDADLYAQEIDLTGLDDGYYFIRLSVGLLTYTKSFLTEPMDVKEYHANSLALLYSHVGEFDSDDIWSYLYLDGWQNSIRIDSNFYKFKPTGEIENYNDDFGITEKLRAVPYRQMTFQIMNVVSWVADKFNVIFAHDTKIINGYKWENEDFGSFEYIGDRRDIGTYSIDLRQKDDRLNSETVETISLTAAFVPDSIEDVPFEGDVYPVVFNSNTPGTFQFRSIPDWIETDVDTFTNGDTIEITVLENSAYIGRAIELEAFSEEYEGLTADLSINQLFEVVDDYIDTDVDEVELSGEADDFFVVNVSSSEDYDITVTGFAFEAVKQSGYTQVRISENTVNAGITNRTATVKLALQSNPLIFKEIDVIQVPLNNIYAVSPASIHNTDENAKAISVTVTAGAAIMYQMSCPQSWVTIDAVIRTGTQTFDIFVSQNLLTSPRFASVTFTNISNPSDNKTLVIQQSGA